MLYAWNIIDGSQLLYDPLKQNFPAFVVALQIAIKDQLRRSFCLRLEFKTGQKANIFDGHQIQLSG